MDGRPSRWIAAVAAYALLLHGTLFGVLHRLDAADPLAADLLAEVTICRGNGTGSDSADLPPAGDHRAHVPACALCGLGHCAVAMPAQPPAVPFPLRWAAVAHPRAAFPAPGQPLPWQASQPRAPPVV